MKTKLPHFHGQEIESNLKNIPTDEDFNAISDVFKVLADSSRIRIFWILCHCEECVINLSAMVDMSSPAVSHHLKLLKSAGLIEGKRAGKEVYYKSATNSKTELVHIMIERISKIACP